ncbi:L-threonine 3-dehydrogenase [Trametes polyzona]|nr:L-threonine 3-dehydrogenase [Trametes polyzona]
MKAILYYGANNVRLEDIPEPVAGRTQVKVKVAWCGICGTDLHYYKHDPAMPPTATEPHAVTGEKLPVVLGHEFSGTIVELGSAVDKSKYAVGQNVAVEPLNCCNQPDCVGCSSSDTRNLCPRIAVVGFSGGGGGLSEYVVVDQKMTHILPPNVSLEVGALVEPLAVAWRSVKKAKVKAGDTVLILGAGPIGIFVLKCAQLFGAAWVGVSGRGSKRCALARTYGASAVYDVSTAGTDVVAETLKATNGRGADVVVDCAGVQSSLDVALKAARPGGRIMNVAAWTESPTIDLNLMLFKELVLDNSLTYSAEHPEVIQAIADGKFKDLESLITRRTSLENFVEKGLGALLHEKTRQSLDTSLKCPSASPFVAR